MQLVPCAKARAPYPPSYAIDSFCGIGRHGSLCHPTLFDLHPNRSRDRARAFSASTSRSRTGAVVCSWSSSRRAASETSVTARWNAAAFACDGALKPESLRTNCSAEARISSSLAGGAKLNSVRMLRHIAWLLVGRRSLTQALPWAGILCSSDLNLVLL